MKKSVFFRLTDEEFEKLELYCETTGRTKSDVLRELVRTLESKSRPISGALSLPKWTGLESH